MTAVRLSSSSTAAAEDASALVERADGPALEVRELEEILGVLQKHSGDREEAADVVGLYMDPPDNAVVHSVDAKTQMQALDRTQPLLPLRPGQVAWRTHDYTRHGAASLYAGFDVARARCWAR
jgi:hypothetical protein